MTTCYMLLHFTHDRSYSWHQIVYAIKGSPPENDALDIRWHLAAKPHADSFLDFVGVKSLPQFLVIP